MLLSVCLFTNCIAAKNGRYSVLFSIFYEVSACTQYIGCMRTVYKLFIMTAVWLWKNCILREKSEVSSIPVRDNYRDTRVRGVSHLGDQAFSRYNSILLSILVKICLLIISLFLGPILFIVTTRKSDLS